MSKQRINHLTLGFSTFFLIFSLFSILYTLIPTPAYAQASPTVPPPTLPKSEIENKNPSFTAAGLPTKIVSEAYNVILPLAGFLTVIFIVISGIQFVTSSGNPEAAAAAKNRLIFALVGFAIIVLAFAILQIVGQLFLGNTGIA